MENVNIQISNYKYDAKQRKQVERKIEFLLRQAPFNSRILLDFKYKDKVFFGKLKLDFDGNSFCASDEDAVLVSLTGRLCKKVHKQVMKWKKTRTVEDITGVIALNPAKKTAPSWDLPPLSQKAS